MSLLTVAQEHLEALGAANRRFSAVYPGDRSTRQPIHTVYGGAQLYKAETTKRLGELALASFRTFAPTPRDLAQGIARSKPASVGRQERARKIACCAASS